MRCSSCGNEVVEITMERGESVFTLMSCSVCDRRRWTRDGRDLPLEGVLSGINYAETEQ